MLRRPLLVMSKQCTKSVNAAKFCRMFSLTPECPQSLFLLQINLRALSSRDDDVTIPEQQEIQSPFSTSRMPYLHSECGPFKVI